MMMRLFAAATLFAALLVAVPGCSDGDKPVNNGEGAKAGPGFPPHAPRPGPKHPGA